MLLLAGLTLSATGVQAQGAWMISKNADFSTSDRDFGENDIIYIKVEANDIDFSSVRISEFRLRSRAEDADFWGIFENHFDGTYSAELPVAELNLVDYLWELEGLIEDAAGNKFDTRALLRIGDAGAFTGFEARAVVEEKGDTYFVLKGHQFNVTSETQFVIEHHFPGDDETAVPPPDEGPIPASFADVQVDFSVRVKANRDETGQLIAQFVAIGGPAEIPGFVGMSGRVERIDNTNRTLEVRGRTVQIMPETHVGDGSETVGEQDIPAWLVGRVIRIYGEFQDDGTILAHYVDVVEGMREELEVRGRVEEVTDNVVLVQGYKFVVDANTSIEYEGEPAGDGTASEPTESLNLNVIDPGLIVRVTAVVTADGVQIAERISIESGDDGGVRISGAVEYVSDQGFGIRGWFILVSEYTGLFDENFEPIGVEDLAAGRLVQVFGEFYEGGIKAHHVEFRRESRDEVTLFGPITELGAGFLRIWDVEYTVTESTRFESGTGEPTTFEGLSVGQLVEATGIPDASGVLNLDRVHTPDGHGDGVRIAGQATNLTEAGFDVLGITVQTHFETRWVDRYYQPIDPAGVAEGAAVQVFGGFQPDGSVMAYEVMLTDADREELELWGSIQAVQGDIVVVSNIDFFFSAESKIFSEEMGEGLTPADLAPGMQISIMGVIDDLGNPVIDWIFVPRQVGDQVRITGQAEAVTLDGMTLWGRPVVFTEFTQFYGADFQPVGPESILEGALVEVFGFYDETESVRAEVVEIRGGNIEELSLTGDVESFDGTVLFVGGTPFRVEAHTQVFVDGEENIGGTSPDSPAKYSGRRLNPSSAGKFSGKAGGLEDLVPGTHVEVIGTLDVSGEYIATVIHIRDDFGSARLSGPIEDVTPESLMLQGRMVLITPETQVQNESFEPVGIETLVPGQGVEVFGQIMTDGSIVAHHVELRPDVPAAIEFGGRIEAVQGDIVFVNGEGFLISDVTFFTSEDGSEFGPANLATGLKVHITGERDDTGALIATMIFAKGQNVWAWMNGEVTGVDGTTLVMQGRTIVTDEGTYVLDADYLPITVADIQAGQTAFVSGELFETGELKAFNVELRGAQQSELEIWGAIAAINGSELEINGRIYVLTDNTVVFGDDGFEWTTLDLTAGQFVGIVARPDGVGGLNVAKVFVQSQQDNSNARMRGAIQEVLVDGFMMQNRMVVFSEETMIVGGAHEPVSLDALSIGQVVNVYGGFDGAGNFMAYQIELQDKQSSVLELRGVIAETDGQTVVVKGIAFAVDEQSVIEDGRGFPIDPTMLAPGMLVTVVGSPTDAGGLRLRHMWVGANDQDRHVYISAPIMNIDHAGRVMELLNFKVQVEEYADVVGPNFEFIRFSDLAPGQSVRLFGQYQEGGFIIAHRVESRDGSESSEIEFRGRIEAMHGDSVRVRNTAFALTPNTHVTDENGFPIPFEELSIGQIVGIAGAPGQNGGHIALRIHVSTGNEDRGMRVAGRIVELDGRARVLVIRDHKIVLNEHAEIVGANYEPIRFDALQVGYQVSVWGWLQDTGQLEGHRVELRIPEKEEFHIVGPLTGIEGTTLRVAGLAFNTTENTYVGAPEIGRLALSNLFPGLIVEVKGVTGEGGGLVAAKVLVYGPDPAASMELLGVVANLSNNQFDIGGIPLTLGDKAFVLDGNNQRISAGSLQDGFSVETAAFDGSAGGLQVRFLRVFDIIQDERSLIGRIDEISGNTFTILDHVFNVTDETVYLDPLGDPMEFTDLAVRMRVEVSAVINASGALVAREVVARPRDRKVTGTVTAIEGDHMAVAGLTVVIDANTVFFDSEGEEISQSSIVPGQTVNLTMILGPGGQPLATEVHLLPRIEDEVVLNGTVEAVLEDLLVVMGRRFQIIPNTQILDVDGNPTTLDTYTVGDAVRIRALLLAGDNLVALRTRELDAAAADIRVEGPIVSVGASTLEVMGIFFFLNAETQYFDLERNEVDVSSLAEGQTVAVVAEGQANGTIAAVRVQVQNVSLTSGEVSGLEGDEFSMYGNNYRVDGNTMVLGENNVQLSLEDIQSGQYLEVRGVADAEGGVAGKNGTSILVSKIKIVDAEGSGEYELEIDPAPTAVEEEELPEAYTLFQNYPNPFNPTTNIRFSLPVNSSVNLRVYDVTGRLVQTLVAGTMTAGTHEVQWNGQGQNGMQVASGVYLYRLEAGGQVITRRMVLVK